MSDAESIESPSVPLDARTLLHQVDRTIRRLRVALGRDHADTVAWTAFGMTAPQAQAARQHLRQLANLLHVERATARCRRHGTRFATLDDQRAWLAAMEHHACPPCARAAGLPSHATLAQLRAGMIRMPT